MGPMTSLVAVPTTDGEMPAHLWLPESGTGPAVLLLQEIFGISDYIRRRAAALADRGYVVLAPVLYWRMDTQVVDESGPDALEQGIALMNHLDFEQAVVDSAAAFGVLQSRDEVRGTPAILGFCLGGGLAFATAARTEPSALVSYYGSALPNLLDLAPRVTCPSLHHFGTADGFLSMDVIRTITEAVTSDGRRATVELHEGADHAFDNDDFTLHHPQASTRAWKSTLTFLDEHR